MPEPSRAIVRLEIQSNEDVVVVRQRAREQSQRAGFSLLDTTKLVTAASELARNTLEHGRGGTVEIELVTDGARHGVKMTFADEGPGIPDLQLALSDGYTSGGGLGLGLGGSRRLVNEFHIESEVGRGTRVTVVRWK
ncbi:MAG TPA: anti-sigma regulatory factor [Kofleriaceae bacterium]|nr:anti-sigma regulatory factor [Kofleriaceae bacterium]